MQEGQSLSVKFQAAWAFEKILSNDYATNLIRPALETVLKCYLSLMTIFDNQELIIAFNNILTFFAPDLKPYAADVCKFLQRKYISCILQKSNESILSTITAVTSMRRLLNIVKGEREMIVELENTMFPCLIHSITTEGVDCMEEAVDCITLILFHGYKNKPISEQLWKVYPQLLYFCAGNDTDKWGGIGYTFLKKICVALKNYINDPVGMLKVDGLLGKDNLSLTYHFISRCLQINRNRKKVAESSAIIAIIVAMLENMPGALDHDFAKLLGFIIDELNFQQQGGVNRSNAY